MKDPVPFFASAGLVFSLTLAEAHILTGIAVGLVTLVYVISKTVLLWTDRRRNQDSDR